MRNYRHIIEYVNGRAWPILPEKGALIARFLERRLRGDPGDEEQILVALGNRREPSPSPSSGTVAVIPIFGTICHRAGSLREWSGGTSTERVSSYFRQAMADPGVSAIVLDVDSPGGTDSGVAELFDLIYESRGRKPITAIANSLMASAAFWIGCAADELVATKSALVGSIGVYMMHIDESKALENEGIKVTLISAGKNKVRGNPFAPLSADDRTHYQALVDSVYARFTRDVARGRGVGTETVRKGFGQGDVVTAQEAKAMGMVDRIGTLEQIVGELASNRGRSRSGAMAVTAQREIAFRRRRLEMNAPPGSSYDELIAAAEARGDGQAALRLRRLRLLERTS